MSHGKRMTNSIRAITVYVEEADNGNPRPERTLAGVGYRPICGKAPRPARLHERPARRCPRPRRRAGGSALDINSFTSVRMLADRVGTTEVLQYQRSVLHVFRVCFAPAPYICWSNCNFSDTVGLSPQICKGNHDEPWTGHGWPPGDRCAV